MNNSSKKVREINQSVFHSFTLISLAALSSYSYSQFLDVKNDLFYRSIKCLYFQSLLLICAIQSKQKKTAHKKAERSYNNFNCTFSSQQVFSGADPFTPCIRCFFNIHHFREEKKIEDISKILYKNRFERARSSCYPLMSIRVSKSFKGISVCIL